jgi:hypothetical protein
LLMKLLDVEEDRMNRIYKMDMIDLMT